MSLATLRTFYDGVRRRFLDIALGLVGSKKEYLFPSFEQESVDTDSDLL